MAHKRKNRGFLVKLATFVVDKRSMFFFIYLAAAVFCFFSMNWVTVENDVTTYLPEETETRQGIVAMNENFTTFSTARVMVSNVTYETAEKIYDDLSAIEGITMVTFDDTADHYKDASALYDVNFDGGNFDEVSLQALEDINTLLAPYDYYIDTLVGYDENAMLRDEMAVILVVAVVIIFGWATARKASKLNPIDALRSM